MAADGMLSRVYVLMHAHELDEGEDDIKLIGCYRTEEAARAAISRLLLQPGFRDHPQGFTIDAFELDADHWVKGFITVYTPEREEAD